MIRTRKCRSATLMQDGEMFVVVTNDEMLEFVNPLEAKRVYEVYLNDDIAFGDEIEAEGYNRYTGEKEKGGYCS